MTTITLSPDPADPPNLIAMIDPAPLGQGTRKVRSKAGYDRLKQEFPAVEIRYDDPSYVDNLPDEDAPDAL